MISQTISVLVDIASATKMIDSGLILGQVKLKTKQIDIQSFPA